MTDEKADNKWRLLDDLGRELTLTTELLDKLKAHNVYDILAFRELSTHLLSAKDDCNKLKSHLINERRKSDA